MSRGQPVLDPVLLAQQPQVISPAIEPHAIEFVLMCAASDPGFLAEARTMLHAHYFTAEEVPLIYVWQAMVAAFDRYRAVTYEILYMLVREAVLQPSGRQLLQSQIDIMFRPDQHGLIWSITRTRLDPVTVRHGREVLRRFLHERTVARPLQQALANIPRGTVPDITGLLQQIQQQSDRLQTMHQLPGVAGAPERGTPFDAPNTFKLTGHPVIDSSLGGQRAGDCNGLIAVTGGGKTTFAAHLATCTAQQCWAESLATRSTPEMVIFFTFEEEGKKLRPRLWSSAFHIPRQKLERMRDWSELTTAANVQPYELALAGRGLPASETERYDAGRVWFEKCFHLFDVSGSDDFPTAGRGGVAELVSYLDRFQQQRQQPYRTVIIDYAGLLVSNAMLANNTDERLLRGHLKRLPHEIRQHIAERFNCTAWTLQQVKGEAGRWSPLKLMHHSDAAESKDFGENTAVCACLGTPCVTTGCRRLNFSKVRYLPNAAVPPVTLRINDTYSSMDDVTESYLPDDAQGRFVSRHDASRVGGLAVSATRQSQMTGPRAREIEVTAGAGAALQGPET